MAKPPPKRAIAVRAEIRPAPRTPAGEAALSAAQDLARKAATPAPLCGDKGDWAHFAQWCAAHGFAPLPAAPELVGAYLARLAGSHAKTTIHRRLSAIGKMHRFNDLPWNPGHRDIQGLLQGMHRLHGRPPQKAAALTLPMLREILATCEDSAHGQRDRTSLLFGFVGALRFRVRGTARRGDIGIAADEPRLRILRRKIDRPRHLKTCPLRAFAAWQAVACRKRRPTIAS